MKIYPKTCNKLKGIDSMFSFVTRDNGVEMQFFDENGVLAPFEFKNAVENLIKKIPTIEEITIHPPLSNYDIECIIYKDINIIKDQLKVMVELSRRYNIKMNIVYHTLINYTKHKELTLDKIGELLKIIEGENVKILLENIFMFFEKNCTVYQIADYFKSENLMVCFDICHLHCRANIEKKNIYEYADEYLDKELCKKYTYQVHFSATLENDGYVKKNTHGRMHNNIKDLKEDLKLLKEYNMYECNYITEITEEDYDSRKDQIRELEMLIKAIEE